MVEGQYGKILTHKQKAGELALRYNSSDPQFMIAPSLDCPASCLNYFGHHRKAAQQARQFVAAAALAVYDKPEAALERLAYAGVITNSTKALVILKNLRYHLDNQPLTGLVNAYIHVTNACNLACSHCYALAKKPEEAQSMSIEDIQYLVIQAAEAGFSKVLITGGEPLVHPQRTALLKALSDLRQAIKPAKLVLRTNLASPLTVTSARQLLYAADDLVVSIDGSPASHDDRRGKGTYALTVNNLRFLLDLPHNSFINVGLKGSAVANISIAAALNVEQAEGPEGDAVRNLAKELNLRVRCKAVLPLGRGKSLDPKLSVYVSRDDAADVLVNSTHPTATCGLGRNLYIDPAGECYPCYAMMASSHYLGNAINEGLEQVLLGNNNYRKVTVDSSNRCCICELRYICGGFCRVWNGNEDPKVPPPDCSALYRRAKTILKLALETLEISKDKWQSAGFPCCN